METQILIATLNTDKPVRSKADALRGYIGRAFPENTLLHQHIADGRTAYLYPRVQYRVTNGVAQIVAIAEGVTAVNEVLDSLSELDLNGWRYSITSIETDERSGVLCDGPERQRYWFRSPWLALSQKNYRLYQSSNQAEQRDLLRRVLIGNVLSMAKSLDIVVTERLDAMHNLCPTKVRVKRQNMLAFTGNFSVNFNFVPPLGLGHLVSIGYGEVAMAN
jgi:hypothetical protein